MCGHVVFIVGSEGLDGDVTTVRVDPNGLIGKRTSEESARGWIQPASNR